MSTEVDTADVRRGWLVGDRLFFDLDLAEEYLHEMEREGENPDVTQIWVEV